MTLRKGWETQKLAEFIELQRGFDLPLRTRIPGPYKVLSSGDAHGWHDEAKIQGPGFVVGRATNIGRPTWSDEDFWPLNTTLFAKDFKGNDPKFAFYWFVGNDLSAYNSGSVQPMLNRNYIANVPVLVPPVSEQRAIAATLGAIDNKIDSDRRRVELIRQLASSTWQALIEGGTKAPLGSILGLTYGKALPARSRRPGAVPVYGSNGITGWHSEASVDGPSVIIGRKGTVGSVHWESKNSFPIDTTFIVEPDQNWPLIACYFAARGAGLSEMNSDSAVPGLNRDRALSAEVLLPGLADAQEWAQITMPLIELAASTSDEIDSLTRMRDALLPELLSGRIAVAQEFVE